MKITIKEVQTKKDLKKFIRFPHTLYKNDPMYIPALDMDEIATLSKTNPAFAHCDARYFLAYKGGEIVGRVAAIINHHANRDWNQQNIRFGWFDVIDDINVTKALLGAVGQWGRENGLNRISGPWGFTDMDKEGLLTEGFDQLQSITTIYNYPYYKDHLEALGYSKDVEWIQMRLDLPKERNPKFTQFKNILLEKYGLSIYKPKSTKELKIKAKQLFGVLNEAYSVLHEFTRLNEKQIDNYIAQYIPLINKDLICMIEDASERIVGFAITMPSLSKAFQKAKGRLFPFGWYHILKALKSNDTVECYLIGVIPEYQNKGLNAIIFDHLHSNYIDMGFTTLVANPQLETNTAAIRLFGSYPTEIFARRRCYFNHLSNQS